MANIEASSRNGLRFKLIAACGVGLLLVLGCGITTPKYVDYTDAGTGTSGGGDTNSACAQEALELFQGEVGKAAAQTCASKSCHQTTPIGGQQLKSDDDSVNRKVLKAYNGSTGTKLFNKISGGSHGGGDQSSAMPEASISTWLAKEAECDKQG